MFKWETPEHVKEVEEFLSKKLNRKNNGNNNNAWQSKFKINSVSLSKDHEHSKKKVWNVQNYEKEDRNKELVESDKSYEDDTDEELDSKTKISESECKKRVQNNENKNIE